MKYLLRILFILALLLPAPAMHAATAKFHKVWLEHGTKHNNRNVLKIYANFTIDNGKGEEFNWCFWLKGPNGEWHKMNNALSSRSGHSYFRTTVKPPYASTNYNDAWMVIYLDDLNMLPGKNSYKVIMTISHNGNELAQSDPVSFTGTGSQNSGYNNKNSGNNSNRNNSNNNNSGEVKTWREELGYGGFVIVKKFPNGYIMRTRYRFCPNCNGTRVCGNCHGTGYCPICNGKGGIVSAGYGNYYPCYSCQSSGLCMFCKGSRVCITCNSSEYPGYVIGSTSTIAPDGTTTRDKVNYNNHDTGYDSNNHQSGKSNGCSKCGGTGVNKTPNSGGSRSSWVAWYNNAGTECPYCGRYTAHYHDRCSSCNVPSH